MDLPNQLQALKEKLQLSIVKQKLKIQAMEKEYGKMSATTSSTDTETGVKPRLPADCLSSISMPKNWNQVEKLKILKEKLQQEIESVARHEKDKGFNETGETNDENVKCEAVKIQNSFSEGKINVILDDTQSANQKRLASVKRKSNSNEFVQVCSAGTSPGKPWEKVTYKVPMNMIQPVDLNPKVIIEPLNLGGIVDVASCERRIEIHSDCVTSSKRSGKPLKADKSNRKPDNGEKNQSDVEYLSLSVDDSCARKSIEKESETGGQQIAVNLASDEASGDKFEELIPTVVLDMNKTAEKTVPTLDSEKVDNSSDSSLAKKQLEMTREMIVNKHQLILNKWTSDIKRYGLGSQKLALNQKTDAQLQYKIPKSKSMRTPKQATKGMGAGMKRYVGAQTSHSFSLLERNYSADSRNLTSKANGLQHEADNMKTNKILTEQRTEGKSNVNTGIKKKPSASPKEVIQDNKTPTYFSQKEGYCHTVDKTGPKGMSENVNNAENQESIGKAAPADVTAKGKDISSSIKLHEKLKSKITSNEQQKKLYAEQQSKEIKGAAAMPGNVTNVTNVSGQTHLQVTSGSTTNEKRENVEGLKVRINAAKSVKPQTAESGTQVHNETNILNLNKILFQNACTAVAAKNKLSASVPKSDIAASVPHSQLNNAAKNSLLNNNVTIRLKPSATKGIAKYAIVEKPTKNLQDINLQTTNQTKSVSNSAYNNNIGSYGMKANYVQPVHSNFTVVSSSVTLVPLTAPVFNNPSFVPHIRDIGIGTFPGASNNISLSYPPNLVGGFVQMQRPVIPPGVFPWIQAPVTTIENSGTFASTNPLTLGLTGVGSCASTYLSSARVMNVSTGNASWKNKMMPVSYTIKSPEPKTPLSTKIITPVFSNVNRSHLSGGELGTNSAPKRPAESIVIPVLPKRTRVETSPVQVVSKHTTANGDMVTVALNQNDESPLLLSGEGAMTTVGSEKQRGTTISSSGSQLSLAATDTGVHVVRSIQKDKKYRFHSGKPRDEETLDKELQDTVRNSSQTSLVESSSDHTSAIGKSGDDESNLALFEQFKIKPYNPVFDMSGYMTQNNEPRKSFKEVLDTLPKKESLKSNESTKSYQEVLESMPRIESYCSLADDAMEQPVNVAIHNNESVTNNEKSVLVGEAAGTNELVSEDVSRVVRVTVDSNKPPEELSLINIPTSSTANGKDNQILNEQDLIEYLCSTNNEKTKLILLNGNVCDRWEQLKKDSGVGDMSDPEFLHHLLSTAEKNQMKAAEMRHAGSQTVGTLDELSPDIEDGGPLHLKSGRNHQITQDNTKSNCPEIIILDDDSRDYEVDASNSTDKFKPLEVGSQHPCIAEWNSVFDMSYLDFHAKHTESVMDWNKNQIQLDQNNCSGTDQNNNSKTDLNNNAKVDLNNNSEVDLNNNSEVDLNNNSEVIENQNPDCNNNSVTNITETNASGRLKFLIGDVVVKIDRNKAVPVETNTEKKMGMMKAGMKRPASVPLEVQTDSMIKAKRISGVPNRQTTTPSQDSTETGPVKSTLSELLKSTARQTVKTDTSNSRPLDQQGSSMESDGKAGTDPITSSTESSDILLHQFYDEFLYNIPQRKDMDWNISWFRDFLKNGGCSEDFEHKSPDWLNDRLTLFYLNVASKHSKFYLCHVGLMQFTYYLNKYVKWLSDSRVNVLEDQTFKKSNDIYNIVCYVDSGFVAPHKTTPVFTQEDSEKLQRSGVLSNKAPVNLLWKVYFDINYYLGENGFTKDYLYSLKKDSLIFCSDEQGNYCTIRDEHWHTPRIKKTKMYEQSTNPVCPFRNVKLYLSKLSAHEALFQYPKYVYTQIGTWYNKVSLSKTKLYNLMKEISTAAELSNHYSLPSIGLLARKHRFLREVKKVLAEQKE